ncbi:uncharacterized protein LOC120274879 [Dioscorea cayenensis subsp. rotundata]|uniref:Uncharacterized protein LOC120274879 n=1 Tax=Dioscorea cayennensis subsp. rotundata TaxID=55577 RepID=A0AB40CCP7_DIOCR|nr:uncharacterized protein LOC120274879 [Dioscorea cayenensis subsp. rotundata]XP_039137357.1 uncharacterized protein LOC120274879 [Dioscorea cayenensis subsp. rotundata]
MDEKRKDANDIPPSRAQMYIMSRTKKDGTIVSEKATEVVEQMKIHMNDSGDSSNKNGWSWENDVYAKVKGPEKRGCVRCVGDVYASSSKSSSSTERNEEVLSLKSYVNGLEQKIELQSQVINQQSQVLAAIISLLNKRFPEENVNDVMGEVNRLINQEAADANSAPNNSPNINRSSNSSFQPNSV